MAAIDSLLAALDEREIARRVTMEHDEARMRYRLSSNTVRDFREFSSVVADYYNYHQMTCISRGGRLSNTDAYGEVKDLLERECRRRDNGDIVSAFNDAHDGTNGGLRVILDIIADTLKARAVERYTAAMFDRHVAPNAWDDKVEIIRQFIAFCGPMLAGSIVASQPERYAHDWSELLRSFVEGLRRTSSIFRRL
jgi:hypothetical protein